MDLKLRLLIIVCTICLVLLRVDSVSAENSKEPSGHYPIYVDSQNGVQILRELLTSWDAISAAIVRYDSRSCVKQGLKLDAIRSAGPIPEFLVGQYKEKLNDLKIKRAFQFNTVALCSKDPAETGPLWLIGESEGEYRVIDSVIVSE